MPGRGADAGAGVPTEDDEQIQEILEVVSPFGGVQLRGRRNRERVPRIGGDGRGEIVRETGVLPELVDADRNLRGDGGELVGDVLQEGQRGEVEETGDA